MSDAKWSRLENAAKIFPSTTSREDTKVFRFTCELTEMVQEAPLQAALGRNTGIFPLLPLFPAAGAVLVFLRRKQRKASGAGGTSAALQ